MLVEWKTENVEVDQTEANNYDTTDSPPLSPPMLPEMSTFTALNSIVLPNGFKLPSDTKQIFVYPYGPSANLTVIKDSQPT